LTTSSEITLVHVTERQERQALRLLRDQSDKRYSFADATSFVVMRDRRLAEALSFDADFAQAGFVTLPKA
jgi:predicted nucleic acid-binding protein